MGWLVVVPLLLGCGRVGFDPSTGAVDAPTTQHVVPNNAVVTVLTGGTSWMVPADWSNVNNSMP